MIIRFGNPRFLKCLFWFGAAGLLLSGHSIAKPKGKSLKATAIEKASDAAQELQNQIASVVGVANAPITGESGEVCDLDPVLGLPLPKKGTFPRATLGAFLQNPVLNVSGTPGFAAWISSLKRSKLNIPEFCPLWESLSESARAEAVLDLLQAVSYRESHYDRKLQYYESKLTDKDPVTGRNQVSVGYTQMSRGDMLIPGVLFRWNEEQQRLDKLDFDLLERQFNKTGKKHKEATEDRSDMVNPYLGLPSTLAKFAFLVDRYDGKHRVSSEKDAKFLPEKSLLDAISKSWAVLREGDERKTTLNFMRDTLKSGCFPEKEGKKKGGKEGEPALAADDPRLQNPDLIADLGSNMRRGVPLKVLAEWMKTQPYGKDMVSGKPLNLTEPLLWRLAANYGIVQGASDPTEGAAYGFTQAYDNEDSRAAISANLKANVSFAAIAKGMTDIDHTPPGKWGRYDVLLLAAKAGFAIPENYVDAKRYAYILNAVNFFNGYSDADGNALPADQQGKKLWKSQSALNALNSASRKRGNELGVWSPQVVKELYASALRLGLVN